MAKKARRLTPEEKLAAVRMLQSGSNAGKVAETFEVSRAIVYRWLQKYNESGDAALEIKQDPGLSELRNRVCGVIRPLLTDVLVSAHLQCPVTGAVTEQGIWPIRSNPVGHSEGVA